METKRDEIPTIKKLPELTIELSPTAILFQDETTGNYVATFTDETYQHYKETTYRKCREDKSIEWLHNKESLARFLFGIPMSESIETATDLNIEYGSDCFYVFYVVDCFSPPCAIIGASDEQDALDIFCSEYEKWILIDDVDLPDYGEDYHVNDNGNPVETDNIVMRQLSIVKILA